MLTEDGSTANRTTAAGSPGEGPETARAPSSSSHRSRKGKGTTGRQASGTAASAIEGSASTVQARPTPVEARASCRDWAGAAALQTR